MKIPEFKNKTLLITGGTGSFGNAVLRNFLDSEIKEIRIFSRDEKKQDDMRKHYLSNKIKFYIGDVRNPDSLKSAIIGVDYIFHAAALKQVPSCEFFPLEAVNTNVYGTENVLNEAINAGVKKIVCLSTDKAVYPINAMGISKAMMEKIIVAKSRLSGKTKICITRYGNVMGSRGSVIPLFLEQIKNNKNITITDPNMTRFMMTLDDAVNLVLYAFKNGNSGDIFVQKSPGATIEQLSRVLSTIKKYNKAPKLIGTRHGEKLYEVLCSREEMAKSFDLGNFFQIPSDTRDLNYDLYFSEGSSSLSKIEDYNSSNTVQLNDEELEKLLYKSKLISEKE